MEKCLILDINDNLNKCYYFMHTFNVLLKPKVTNCKTMKDLVETTLENGAITLTEDVKVTKVRRPSNIIDTLQWCYMLKNKDGELLGYICKK